MAKSKNEPAAKAPSRLPWILGAAALVVVVIGGAMLLGNDGSTANALQTVSVSDLAGAVEDGATVIDVREPYEYEDGHVAGAQLMPLADTVRLASDLPKDEPVYVICRSGNRSMAASEALVAAGFQDVRNVGGGMIAWQAAGLPVAR